MVLIGWVGGILLSLFIRFLPFFFRLALAFACLALWGGGARAASTTLDNGVDPWNFGKGDWIWLVPESQVSLGLSNVQQLVSYETNKGMAWITVKCGDGGSIYSQFSSSLVTACHNAGLKVYGWGYSRGSNVTGEINVALNCLGLGADGFIIDAEIQYETNVFGPQDAIKYCQAIRAAYPNRFLGYAPSPSWSLHQTFPYREFGMYCDAVMPQCYWGYRGITPQAMVTMVNTQWVAWMATLSGSGTNAIKPLIPAAQADVDTVPGSDESDFVYYLQTYPTPVTPKGFHGVSFWDCQEHSADQWTAIGATNIALMTTNAPGIPGQPYNQCVDPGGTAVFGARAYGAPTLRYQWRFNGTNITSATGSSLSVTGAQATNAGSYTVVVTNASGAVTSRVAKLTVTTPSPVLQLAFADDFETNSAALWSLFQGSANSIMDFTTNWAFDYSTQSYRAYTLTASNFNTALIPVAPSTTNGTRSGLKLAVNKNDGTGSPSGISLYPKNLNFGSNYVLKFDAWINYNGGPGGGSGSTEYLTCGLDHTGTRANWLPDYVSASDGHWYAVDGEGGSGGTDYRAYQGNGGVPSTLTVNSSGMDVSGAVSFDYVDLFYGKIFGYPNYESPGIPGKHWVQVELSQFNNVITWRLNGAVFAQRTNTSVYGSGNVMIGYMDPYSSIANPAADNYVIIDNVRVYTAVVAPVITNQPAGSTVNSGANWTAAAAASGTTPLAWQWKRGTTNVSGATGSSLTLSNVSVSWAGTYSVVATNAAGSAISSNAVLNVVTMQIASFGETNAGQFQLVVSGAPGSNYAVQISTNLSNWSTIKMLTNTTGVVQFVDGGATSAPTRFYRVLAP